MKRRVENDEPWRLLVQDRAELRGLDERVKFVAGCPESVAVLPPAPLTQP